MKDNLVSNKQKMSIEIAITLMWGMVCLLYMHRTHLLSSSLGLSMQWKFFFMRVLLLVIPYMFIMLFAIWGKEKFCKIIYEKRFGIALGLFGLMVLCKINYSSMAMYDAYVQPGTSSIWGYPLFGTARAIRSDEWIVTLPRLMSTDYAGYGLKNSIVRATTTDNLSASGLYFSFSSLAHPVDWGYYIFRDSSYGLAWSWNFKLIFGFLTIFELIMLLTQDNKKVSVFGAVLIWLSTFSVWWSMVTSLFTGSAAVVLFAYFLREKNIPKRLLYGVGTAIFVSNFVVDFYPAWQVPEAYIFLAIVIWILITNWEQVKAYKLKDYLLVVAMLVLAAGIALKYIYDYQSYMVAIMNTEYPGGRMISGGYSLNEMYTYLVASLASFTLVDNPCEMGTIFAVFPLGIIVCVIVLWKERGKDLLLWLLLIPTVLLTLYCCIPLPEIVAKATLLSYSTPSRAQDMLAVLMALFLLIGLSKTDKMNLPIGWSLLIVGACVCPAIQYAYQYWNLGKKFYVALIGGVIAISLLTCMISRKNMFTNIAYLILTLGLAIVALRINPVMSGTDAIKSRPVAQEVEKIVLDDQDGKWIALDSMGSPNFLIACGAPTYNSTNYIPNMDLWKILDSDGEYNECYNRYAHVMVNLTDGDTSVELISADLIYLHLSYDDLSKIDVSYIYSQAPIERYSDDLIYDEYGVYIYKVQ